MDKKLSVFSSFIIMISLGSIYAWSIFVPGLIKTYGLTVAQTQIIFGSVVGIFPLTMIWAAKLNKKIGSRWVATFSGLFYFIGFLVAYLSAGNFILLWLGIGVFGGIGTGLGYLVSLSVPVKWYPQKKGLITGVSVAGFGAGAIILTYIAEYFFSRDMDVLTILLLVGILYGLLIVLAAQKLKEPEIKTATRNATTPLKGKGIYFFQLITGIFAGTFTGLLIIGNLKPIAQLNHVAPHTIPVAISVFSLANFLGRIVWGWFSDKVNNMVLIPSALLVQSLAAITMLQFSSNDTVFIFLVFIIGFCFGANFVLFAKDTMHKFGILNYEKIYPYIFLGYALAGFAGPFVGGRIYDLTGNYLNGIIIALVLSVIASVTYLSIQLSRKEDFSG